MTNKVELENELEKLTEIVMEGNNESFSVVSFLPYLLSKNIRFAENWENCITNGFADELDKYIPRVTKEIGLYSAVSTSDCISFWGYVLYLLTDRRVITNEEIAKLNKELEGSVGDIIFGR